jgi:heme oxygenase
MSAPVPAEGLVAALRAATAAAHARAEALLHPLAAPEPREAYLRYLARQNALLAALEPALSAAYAALGLEAAPRRRAHLAAADLAALGAPPAVGTAALGGAPGPLPGAVGWVYVVEGQTLGGRALLRALGPRLGIGPARGGRFLDGHGEESGRRFAELCRALEAFDAGHPGARPAVLAAAVAAFERIAGFLAAG